MMKSAKIWRGSLLFVLLLVLAGNWTSRWHVKTVRADSTEPRLYLDQARRFAVSYQGTAGTLRAMSRGQATPLSLASDDFDSDGVNDLAVGLATRSGGMIALHRGNLDAFAPQSEASFQAIAQSQFPSPYLPDAQLTEIPDRPDFLAAGDFIGHGGPGLVAAARGGSSIYVLAPGVSGKMELLQTLTVPGAITALAAHCLQSGKYAQVVIGIHGENDSELLIYSGSNEGLQPASTFQLSNDATAFAFGNLDGDGLTDVLVLAGGEISILHGASETVELVQVPFLVATAALGNFVFDRSPISQMALLDTGGVLHLFVRDSIDQRPVTVEEVRARRQAAFAQGGAAAIIPPAESSIAWKEIESHSLAYQSGGSSVMLRTRISNNGADDVMLMSPSKLSVLAHTDQNPTSGVLIERGDLAAGAVAALSVRVNVDARPGVVFVTKGDPAPHVMMPLPDPTFFVNTTTDPTPPALLTGVCNNTSFADLSSQCSLREAILKANGDTIMLQALTYSLTIGRPATPDYTGHAGALYVNNSATIVGASQSGTIIQWGMPSSGTVDMVMAVNEDINPITNASASLSNLTIQNGVNHGTSGNDGDGGCMEFDTGSSGTATLTLTNVTIQNCFTLQGGGGGIVVFNFTNHGSGFTTISNSIFQNNSVTNVGSAGNGGGIGVAQDARIVMTNSHLLNNKATQVCTPTCGDGDGGGIIMFAPQNVSAATAESFIHSSTISGNKSAGSGGGIWNGAELVIDQGTVISNNVAGTDGTNPVAGALGGGIDNNLPTAGNCPGTPFFSTCTATLTKVTITGNTASSKGGGISNGNSSGAGTLTMSFSRLTGNTASAGNNLENIAATATVTDNWWGTNSPAGTINTTGGATTFDPFIVLSLNASPGTIDATQTSTLTADFLHDNHGTSIALSNIGVLLGLPITFNNASHGTLSSPQASIQSNGGATATFTGTTPGGVGGADAEVDNGTATATITVDEPASVAADPTADTVCAPSNATFSATANGFHAPTIQWQVSTDGGVSFTNLAGAISNPLTFATSGSENNNQYRAVFTNTTTTGLHNATTAAAILTVNTAPVVNSNPTNQTVTAGQTATFMASATGQPTPTVQWQVSTNGGISFSNISGANSTTLNISGATTSMNGNQYRAVFANTCSSGVPSNAATLTVNPPATVTNVTSTIANGSYGVGAIIPIQISFSKVVNVTGTPLLALNSGGAASYSSGSGTATLTFIYTVAAGQNSAALDATSSTALWLNGGTITDSTAAPANLTLPAPGAAGSLSANKSIVIDTTAPTVVSYNVLFGAENFNLIGSARNRLPWQISGITVVFSKPIATANTSSLGGVTATGLSGLGTNTLTWTINPLTLGSFSTTLAGSGPNAIKDAAGNALTGGAGFSEAFKVLWGDFNDDGVVNASDMVLVNNARVQPYNIFADMNGDGVVNVTDVAIVRQRLGTSLP